MQPRRARGLISIVFAMAVAGCARRCEKPGVPPAPRLSPSVQAEPATPAPPWPHQAILDADPEHPYNRLFRALYSRRVEVSIARCVSEDAGESCLGLNPITPFGSPVVKSELDFGRDELNLFIGGDTDFLLTPARRREIGDAVEAIAKTSPLEHPSAALLLQNDVWERFDALAALDPGDAGAEIATLKTLLAKAMKELALAPERIASIPPNRGEIAAANAELVPDFATGDGWLEITERSNEQRTEPLREGTRHAGVFGNRVVFRIFVRVPAAAGGADRLRSELAAEQRNALPAGSVLALVASPLALAENGEIVATPLISLVELRIARGETDEVRTLSDAKFEVLEGRRALLASSQRPGGGLERLRPDAPIPFGATCSPSPRLLSPMRAVCATCHGIRGAMLTGPMTHGDMRFEEQRDPEAPARVVIAAKRATPAFGELSKAFPR